MYEVECLKDGCGHRERIGDLGDIPEGCPKCGHNVLMLLGG